MNPPTDLNLSNYQRYWEEIHQNTVKLIQQIKGQEHVSLCAVMWTKHQHRRREGRSST